MMSHTNSLCINGLQKLVKVMITQFSGSHFDAHTMHLCIGTSIEVNPMKRDVLILTKRFAKLFIAVAFIATKMKITMNSLKPVAQLLQYQQQAHAIGTTRKRNKIALVWV